MAVETFPPVQRRSFFDRAISMPRINLEVVAYIVVVLLSVMAHLWNLGGMAMHHDESIHAWASWKFYTGSGGFSCASGGSADTYCYDPIYHGPSLYFLTLFSYILFGDGDAQARLPMALTGIGMVASCWMLRPYLGRGGALIAAVLLGFSPSLLYYTRFARHDGLMVLWELWMVIGVLRYLDTGKAGYLYLLAASLALAVGTHELYYILFFIFGILILTRLVAESSYARYINPAFGVVLALCAVVIVLNPPLPVGEGLYLGEKMFLVAATLLLSWLASRVWSSQPVLIPRLVELWTEQRRTLWVALGILVSLYLVLYTTFFAYPRGAIDGLYAGLAYWLGSQQEFARGGQPWYYYLMLITIYEPLGLLAGLGAAGYLFSRRRTHVQTPEEAKTQQRHAGTDGKRGKLASGKRKRKGEQEEPAAAEGHTMNLEQQASALSAPPESTAAQTAPAHDNLNRVPTGNLFALLLVVWYFSAIVIFSWAGEKMPWLVTHMALPGNLLAAWVLARLIGATPFGRARAAGEQAGTSRMPQRLALLVPPAMFVLVVALVVALGRLFAGGEGQEAQINLLQAIIPLAVFGMMIYALLTLAQAIGGRAVLALAGLTVAGVLGVYMVRSTWLVVYDHPDVAVEPLIYTQTSPDVPLYVEDIRDLAIYQTRNYRNAEDVTGGLSMPVVVSNGDESGVGSLAWPLQWYFRNFQHVVWMSKQDISNAGPQTFEVELPDGSRGLAPALLLFSPHVTENTRAFLQENYVQPYGTGGVFNWWFPEGDKCKPDEPGYKRFYFNALTSRDDVYEEHPRGCYNAPGLEKTPPEIVNELFYPWTPLVWPFLPENWEPMWQYLMFRDLPEPLQPGSRDMEVWIRNDLMSSAGSIEGVTSGTTVRLLAQQAIGELSGLDGPTGIAVDSQGTIYVADTQNHRIQVFDSTGQQGRTIGSQGNGLGEFYEPRGLAIDAQDNLYIADTWNARIVKMSPNGDWLRVWGTGAVDMGDGRMATITDGSEEENAQNPLGFFGPRGVAVDDQGHVYIADTGNKRIVVTDDDGTYLYQWGAEGSAAGMFQEPTSITIDKSGMLYVADTWNSRVQVFEIGLDGRVSPLPILTWKVPGWSANTYYDPYIAASGDGRIYVSVPARNQVLAASPIGEISLRWGGSGQDMASLELPSGIAVGPSGDVYVVDRQRERILRFTVPDVLPR